MSTSRLQKLHPWTLRDLIEVYQSFAMKYYLEPFGLGENILRRINLYDATAEEVVVLGRNEATGLIDTTSPNFQYVSRRHILVKRRANQVFMQPQASQEGVVYLNGQQCNNVEVELRVNDWFSMLGVKQYYNYRLKLDEEILVITNEPVTTAPPVVVNMLDQSFDTIAHDYDRPASLHESNSSSSQLNKLTLSQPGTSPHPALRTQSFSSNKSASQGLQVANNNVEIVDLDTTPVEIITTSTITNTTIPTAVELAPAVPAAPPVPAVDAEEMERTITKGIVTKMLRQYECSICYETLACAMSLHPCGCCFCYVCIADWSAETKKPSSNGEVQCPLCQTNFLLSNALSNRTVDSAVREVLQNIPSELAAWEKRVHEGSERRRQVEASMGTNRSSSSSSLNNLAAAVAAPSAPRPTNAAAATNGTNRVGGLNVIPRNEVVELLDSQPDMFASAFPPPRGRAAAAPSRPRDIVSFFGRSDPAAGASASAAPASLPTASVPRGAFSEDAFAPRFGGVARHRYIDERDMHRASLDLPSHPSSVSARKRGRSSRLDEAGPFADVAGTGASSSSSNSGTAASSSTTGRGDVLDLTEASSPSGRRMATVHPIRAVRAPGGTASILARAIAAPAPAPAAAPAVPTPTLTAVPAPAPASHTLIPGQSLSNNYGEKEFFCVMPVVDLPYSTACTTCTRSFQGLSSALGIFCRQFGTLRKPVSKAEWLTMCTDWRCPLCVASFNTQRRSTRGAGRLVDYPSLELKENLNFSEKMTWYNLFQV